MDLFNTDEISYKYNFLRMDACAVEELFYKMEVNRGVTFVQKGGTAKRSVAKPNCDLRSSTEVDYDGKWAPRLSYKQTQSYYVRMPLPKVGVVYPYFKK